MVYIHLYMYPFINVIKYLETNFPVNCIRLTRKSGRTEIGNSPTQSDSF